VCHVSVAAGLDVCVGCMLVVSACSEGLWRQHWSRAPNHSPPTTNCCGDVIACPGSRA
jgi:uncharacterized Fe-S center protein